MTFKFRQLTPAEEANFRKWARENYKPLNPIEGIWHPVVQDECAKINAQNGIALGFQEMPTLDQWTVDITKVMPDPDSGDGAYWTEASTIGIRPALWPVALLFRDEPITLSHRELAKDREVLFCIYVGDRYRLTVFND